MLSRQPCPPLSQSLAGLQTCEPSLGGPVNEQRQAQSIELQACLRPSQSNGAQACTSYSFKSANLASHVLLCLLVTSFSCCCCLNLHGRNLIIVASVPQYVWLPASCQNFEVAQAVEEHHVYCTHACACSRRHILTWSLSLDWAASW